MLEALVRNPKAAPNEVQEALKYISKLAAAGSQPAATLDAVKYVFFFAFFSLAHCLNSQ